MSTSATKWDSECEQMKSLTKQPWFPHWDKRCNFFVIEFWKLLRPRLRGVLILRFQDFLFMPNPLAPGSPPPWASLAFLWFLGRFPHLPDGSRGLAPSSHTEYILHRLALWLRYINPPRIRKPHEGNKMGAETHHCAPRKCHCHSKPHDRLGNHGGRSRCSY